NDTCILPLYHFLHRGLNENVLFFQLNLLLTSLYNEVKKVCIQNDQIGFTFNDNKYTGNVIINTSIFSWKYLYL
ncbi:hypothetical protein V7183_04890, partial [Bacillus sp. JJ1127]|uniref:hypothetical protein n=1 Tax=Bacillus sp. JJ1127 TaxID=3122952 RepID=UPI002FFEFEB7